MLHGTRRGADAFPARCEVRGCSARPEEWFELGASSFDVCHAHGLQLRAGEAHSVEGAELLIGLESAPELIEIALSDTRSGPVATLELGHHGVIDQAVPVRVTPMLRAALRALPEGPPDSL